MVQPVMIDEHEITITPVFKMMEIENIPKSEVSGHAVMEIKEVVEVRFAGHKNYAPVFPADAFWRREGNQVFTYAERWPEQYRQFKEGNPQEANGTPLEMLRTYGVKPEQLSLCRALKIYSIEALHTLDHQQSKTLGTNQRALKDAAAQFMADRSKGMDQAGEIDALRARIAELEARSTVVPEVLPTLDEVEQTIAAADAAYAEMSDGQIKDEIEKLTQVRPRGNPSRATLENMLSQALAA